MARTPWACRQCDLAFELLRGGRLAALTAKNGSPATCQTTAHLRDPPVSAASTPTSTTSSSAWKRRSKRTLVEGPRIHWAERSHFARLLRHHEWTTAALFRSRHRDCKLTIWRDAICSRHRYSCEHALMRRKRERDHGSVPVQPLVEQEVQPQIDRVNFFGRGTLQFLAFAHGIRRIGSLQQQVVGQRHAGANNDGGVYKPGIPSIRSLRTGS